MTTTLNQIRECEPCKSGWEKLLKGLGKTKGDDEPLDLLIILEINGFEDTLWCLKTIRGYDRELRLFAVSNAKRVRDLIPRNELEKFDEILDVATRYANGEATRKELAFARDFVRNYACTSVGACALSSVMDSAQASAVASIQASAWFFGMYYILKRFRKFLKDTK